MTPERTAEQVRGRITEIDVTEKEPDIIYLTPVEPLSAETASAETIEEELDHHHAAAHGEHLWVDERLVLSPANGRFWQAPEESAPERGEFLLAGEVIGHVVAPDGKPVAVRSPFSGWAMGFLIPNGSPVKNSEPVLWLRTL